MRNPVTRLLLIPLLLVALTAACSEDEPASGLPGGKQLLTRSADAMDGVNSVHFVLKVEGDRPSNFQITDAEGQITREGGVSASAKVLQAGTLVEYEYIVADEIPYLKGPTGGFRQVPEAIYSRIFDPTGLLSGERSLPNALRKVENATTEDEDDVDGVDTYRVKGDLDPTQVEGLSLLASGVEGEATIWVNKDTKEMVRARVPFTISGQDGETVVTVTLSEFNAPADIKAPV
jgi:lipoprotein LprG